MWPIRFTNPTVILTAIFGAEKTSGRIIISPKPGVIFPLVWVWLSDFPKLDKKTKELIERKPHIHIVIPKTNLQTNKRLDPFEIVEHNQAYIDAFQEVVNEKYGLASPKMNIRSNFTSESTVIERSKGDTFKGANKAIKEEVLKHVLTMPSSSLNDLSAHLVEQGYEVKERDKGKENNYLNIKEQGKSKGVNLNDTVFTERFLSLPIEQKQQNQKRILKKFMA